MAPSYMIDPTVPPTVVSQASDVTGLVNTGQLVGLLNQADAALVLESIERISANKLGEVNTMMGAQDAVVKDLVQCGYVDAAYLVDKYGNAAPRWIPTSIPISPAPAASSPPRSTRLIPNFRPRPPS